MKIAKLTWLHNENYGSVLQALALQRYIRECGYDITDLDYRVSKTTKLINWIKSRNSPKLFLGKIKAANRKGGFEHPELIESRSAKFREFKQKNLKLSVECTNPRELKREAHGYDVFICGSDQIWSPVLLNPDFYLTFVSDGKTKIAYAPSFGVTGTTAQKKKKIRKYLNSFQSISVREEQGKDFVKELTGKDVPVVVDPTMLLNGKEWEAYVKEVDHPEKYIFCYLLSDIEAYKEAARNLAREKNLDIVVIPPVYGPFEDPDMKIDIGPAEWLYLIMNADYVCTDSFHGAIFSLIFHREFVLFKRFADDTANSENSRIYTLSDMVGINDRIIGEENIGEIAGLGGINFKKTDKIISDNAEKSGLWLRNALKESGGR